MERRIDLDGCLNFRDLGGYPTKDGRRIRWRRVFRSDGLHLLSPPDILRLDDEFKVSDIVDLRSTAERRADPRRPLDEHAEIRSHHAPLFDGDRTQKASGPDSADLSLAEKYMALLNLAKNQIATTLRIIAEARGSAVYHCAAGKDRTGVVSLVLLGALDVRPEIIIADYAATRENLDRIIERLQETRGYDSVLEELPSDTLHAEPETMRDLLEAVGREYGSVREYARTAGVDSSTLERLERRLLEQE